MSIEIRKERDHSSIYSYLYSCFFSSSLVRIPLVGQEEEESVLIKEKKKEIIFFFFFFCVVLILGGYGYLKLKYGFWFYQPVFHWYDVTYYFRSPQVILSTLPMQKKNKYVNHQAIAWFSSSTMTSLQWTQALNTLSRCYLHEKDNQYLPTPVSLSAFFLHNPFFFFSFYQQSVTLFHHLPTRGLPQLTKEEKIIGMMTSRKVQMVSSAAASTALYYVDYLCVDPMMRKQGIAPQLIATHYDRQTHADPQTPISLFKREGELTGIVPLTVYKTYLFDMSEMVRKTTHLHGRYKLVAISKANFSIFWNFIKEEKEKANANAHANANAKAKREEYVWIHEPIETLLHLLDQNIFFFFCLVDQALPNVQVIAMYCFRNPFITIYNKYILTCFASLRNEDHCSLSLFVNAFLDILKTHLPTTTTTTTDKDKDTHKREKKRNILPINVPDNFQYLTIETCSHNLDLTNYIFDNQDHFFLFPLLCSPTAYFFYNYIFPVTSPQHCLFLL